MTAKLRPLVIALFAAALLGCGGQPAAPSARLVATPIKIDVKARVRLGSAATRGLLAFEGWQEKHITGLKFSLSEVDGDLLVEQGFEGKPADLQVVAFENLRPDTDYALRVEAYGPGGEIINDAEASTVTFGTFPEADQSYDTSIDLDVTIQMLDRPFPGKQRLHVAGDAQTMDELVVSLLSRPIGEALYAPVLSQSIDPAGGDVVFERLKPSMEYRVEVVGKLAGAPVDFQMIEFVPDLELADEEGWLPDLSLDFVVPA